MPKPEHRTPQTLDHDSAGDAVPRHPRRQAPRLRRVGDTSTDRGDLLQVAGLDVFAPDTGTG